MLFRILLKRLIRFGTVRLIEANSREYIIGSGEDPRCTVRLRDKLLGFTLALNPSLSVGEAFMNGRLTVDDGRIYDFLEIIARNLNTLDVEPLWARIAGYGHRFASRIGRNRAKRNAAHHYDLSGELYRLFLDADEQYSCAYFSSLDDSLEQAQLNKKRHLAAKLYFDRPGLKVLDIGSGWGGLGIYLAGEADADVTGITLSDEQHKVSNERVAESGLGDRVRFEMRDYREETSQYDRVVSVGMLEHVGRRSYREYFDKIADLMTDDGVAVVHSIGYFEPPGPINPFIRKYIFPGADLPSLSEICAAVEHSGLFVTDIEVLRLHYAETLRAWRRKFVANWDQVMELYDERFCRMWLFYLALCEIGFRHRTTMVFQIQLTKRIDTLPITRDYMVDWERERLADPQAARRRLRSVNTLGE